MVDNLLSHREYLDLSNMLRSCINRMNVTNDQNELSKLYKKAGDCLHDLYSASECRIAENSNKDK